MRDHLGLRGSKTNKRFRFWIMSGELAHKGKDMPIGKSIRQWVWVVFWTQFMGLSHISAGEISASRDYSDGYITVNFERQPLEKVLAELVRPSGKRLIFEANLNEATTLSLSHVPWRAALKAVLNAHGLEKVETQNNLIIMAGKKRLSQSDLRLQGSMKPVHSGQALKTQVATQYRISGITGNQDQRMAIVEYQGESRLWKIGTQIKSGFQVQSILEDKIVLINPQTGSQKSVSF
jgi:hypothetical protein